MLRTLKVEFIKLKLWINLCIRWFCFNSFVILSIEAEFFTLVVPGSYKSNTFKAKHKFMNKIL